MTNVLCCHGVMVGHLYRLIGVWLCVGLFLSQKMPGVRV